MKRQWEETTRAVCAAAGSRMRYWATTTVPVSAPCTHRPRITLTLVRSAGTSSRPIRSRCRLRRSELLAALERTLLPSIAEAAQSSPERNHRRLELCRSRSGAVRWELHHRAAPGGPHLHRVCRTAGWRRGAGSNQPGNYFALSQCHDRSGLAAASRLCRARGGHQFYDANASRIVTSFAARTPRAATYVRLPCQSFSGVGRKIYRHSKQLFAGRDLDAI